MAVVWAVAVIRKKNFLYTKFFRPVFRYLFLFFILFSCITAASGQQSYTSLKFFGLSLHPYGDENAELMPLNPDGRGYLTLNLGGVPGHEIRIAESRFSVKVLQALYYDCAGQTGGFSHIGFRAIIRNNKNH